MYMIRVGFRRQTGNDINELKKLYSLTSLPRSRGERGLCCSFRFIFLETIQKILGSVGNHTENYFLANSLFLSFTRFLWVLTSYFWSSNNVFFCSTEILDVLLGNKFSSFCSSRKLRKSNIDNLDFCHHGLVLHFPGVMRFG
ncbi:hypothetical protein NC651_004234 [Populus alba x Populus x berolinensis]|nr:hypothetical protein NC651_004234 [Populus alba x Populus x berolinensis]